MLALTIAALLVMVTIASVITLADCWVRGRYVFEGLKREEALLDAGFLPMNRPVEQRPRPQMRFDALAMPGRIPGQRLAADRQRSRRPSPARGAA